MLAAIIASQQVACPDRKHLQAPCGFVWVRISESVGYKASHSEAYPHLLYWGRRCCASFLYIRTGVLQYTSAAIAITQRFTHHAIFTKCRCGVLAYAVHSCHGEICQHQ